MRQRIDTVIFDMDGLLIDSEPLWEQAGGATLARYGATLSHAQYATTTGLRTLEWLQHWFQHFGIDHKYLPEATEGIINQVIALIQQQGKALPGVHYLLEYFQQRGLRMGLATSSPLQLAEVVIQKLGIEQYLYATTSAEHLPLGKPHPEVYLHCASQLGAMPYQCLCFEDSFNGMIAAKAAKMKCVIVPAATQVHDKRWGAADLKISSLQNFNDLLFQQLR